MTGDAMVPKRSRCLHLSKMYDRLINGALHHLFLQLLEVLKGITNDYIDIKVHLRGSTKDDRIARWFLGLTTHCWSLHDTKLPPSESFQ